MSRALMTSLWMVVVAGLAGCAQSADEAASLAGAATPQCAADSDCALGTACNQALAICAKTDVPAQSVSIVAAPPSYVDLAAAHLPSAQIEPGTTMQIRLPRTVHITGRVSVAGNDLQPSVSSVLTLRRLNVAAPTALGVVKQVTATASAGFQLYLEAGVDYDMTINVEDADRPPTRVLVNFDKDGEYNFVVPPLDDFPLVEGRVKRVAVGGDFDELLENVRVTALNTKTREACTSSVTDMWGVYKFRCPLEPGMYNLLVSPIESGPVVPSFTAVIHTKTEFLFDGHRTMDDIILSEHSRDTPISIQVTGPEGAVESVPVTVETRLPEKCVPDPECRGGWIDARVVQSGITDNAGTVTLSVIECDDCTYEVSVTPHPSHTLGIGSKKGWDISESSTTQIVLAPKATLTGTALSFSGIPVGDTRIVARRLIGDVPVASASTEYVTSTAGDGTFELPVDAGDYQITAFPPDTAGLPRWLDKGGVTSIGAEGAAITLQFRAPSVLQGHVTDPGGSDPVADVSVDVFSIAEPVRLLGSGTTAADGSFFVILPSPGND